MSWAPAEVLEEDFTPPEALDSAEDFVPPEALEPALPAAVPSPAPQPDDALNARRDAERNGQAAADQGIKEGIFPQGSTPWKTLDGRLYIDPARYNMAVEQMWNLGVIDSTNYTELLKGTVDQWDEASQSYIPSVEKATAARRDLERRAGAFPQVKAAASGLLKGAMQTGAAIVAAPAAAALTIPTGPGAIGVGILAGTGTAIGVGAAYDKALEASAKESELLDSFYAANQLAPGYNSAGQLVSILAPTPVSVSRLANAANLIRAEKGGAEAAKFISGALGTGAAIGVGTDVAIQAANIGLDKLIHPEINPLIAAEQYRQTGQQPPQRPEFDPASTAISGTLGALTAGIGVKARNRVYFADELPLVEQKVKLGTATREEAADYFSMRRTVEILREDQRLIDAGAIAKSTVDFMGKRVLDTNTVINPRFQRDILTQAGFEPPVPAAPRPSQPAIPYATENPQAAIPLQGQPATYTGQAFLNRGGAAPAFQSGSNALPGPEGIQALPAPAAVNPQVNPPVVSDTQDKFYLHVPFQRKEGVKLYGAKFDPERKLWYLNRSETGEFPLISPSFVRTAEHTTRSAKELEGARINAQNELGKEIEISPFEISSGTAYGLKIKGGDWLNKNVTLEIERRKPKQVNPPDTFDPSTATEIPPTASASVASTLTAPEATGSPEVIAGEGVSVSDIAGMPTVDFPVANLKLSKDVPNFKENADPKTGVVQGEALQGKVDRRGLAPIIAWRRLNGDVEVISGRHRLDLFRRNQEETIPTQIFNEADGFTKQDALTLDAELNIRDGQGTTKDYSSYFRNAGLTYDQATERSLLSRAKGRAGFSIGAMGTDDLYALHQGGRIPDAKAEAIAVAAPRDVELQRIGITYAKDFSPEALTQLIRTSQRAKSPSAKQGDLFGNSDDNLNKAVALVKASQARIQVIDNQILSVKGAVKRPEAAREMGVDVKNPEAILAKIAELQQARERYVNFLDDPATLAEVRVLAFGEEQVPLFTPTQDPFNLTSEPPPPATPASAEDTEAARRAAAIKDGYDSTPSMFDAGPSRPRSKSMADAGPQAPIMPAAATIPKPALNTYNDAQVFADYPDAVGVVRAMNGTWTMPLILGGLDKVPVVEMPEAVEFVKSLSGDFPTVRVPRKQNALGSFSPNGQGVITLHPDLIKAGGEASAMMTFMHEIGHFIQFMDDFRMQKGNLLGIIAGVKTLKHSVPLDPNEAAGNPITSKQREAIRQKAEADLRASLAGEVRKVIVNEPIYAQSGVTPEIVKGLFGLDAREQWPELYDWFARQDGATKANIVKQAMKGILDSRLAKFQVQGEQIGTNTREETQTVGGREPTQDELREAFHAAMRAEMNARNVADLKYIRQELIDLTKWWKPFDITRATPQHLAYRFSSEELFADAMSVLLNSPADLKARAPIFYDTFWNNLDSRPQVKAKLVDIYDRISKGRDAVLDKRLARDMEAFKAGAEIFISKSAAAQARRASLTGWWENLKDQYWNIYQPIIDSAAKARAAGKITPAQEDSIRWLTEEHPLAESKLQVKLADIGRLYQSLDAAGVARENFGIFLKYHRIANERLEVTREIDGQMEVVGETGRAVMFNPGGETDRTAREALARLQVTLGPEGYAALETAVSGFRDVIYSIMEDANQSGLFSAELWKTISANKDNYAAFTPLEYVQEYLPSTIRKQVGTFKEIADPLQQTVLKVISIHRAAQNNRFTREAVRVIRQTSPELVTAAPMKYNGKTMEPQPPKDSALSMVEWKVNGQRVGAHIPKRYAAMWEDKSPAERDAILRLLSTGFQRLVYGAIIRYNPAFQLFMSPARDLQRSLTNMPGGIKGRARFVMRLLDPETWGASIDWAQGDVGKTQLMREMVESAATGGPHSAFGGRMGSDDDSIDAILRKFHLQDSKSRNLLTRAIMAPLKAIEFAGQILQMLPKASAYKVLVKDMGMPAPQAANTIRNHIGIPNYYKKGRHASSAGAIVPFLNIFLRSYESLQRNFRGAERNMNAKEWWLAWLFTGGGLIAVLQTLAKEGVLGEELQKLYSRVPNWDMTNFAVIPLGNVSTGDTGGKTAYLRLPQDEGLRVINGVVGKVISSAIRTAKGDPTAPQLGEVFGGISSQVPGQNTLIEVGQNWTTFLAGRNPRDDFRNRNILSEDQWLAGGWEATKPMLGWTLGATGITNFFNYDTEADTLTEMTISATPVLNKFLKISDRGVYQNDLKLNQADERDMAKVRLSLPDFVNGLRTEYNYLKTRSEQRSEREEFRYQELGMWNRAYRNAMDEVETSMELGNRSSAQSAIRSLVQESEYYKQR
jgi:hypothetical protein